MIRFACQNCKNPLRADDDKAGKQCVCPKCKAKQVIPAPPKALPPSRPEPPPQMDFIPVRPKVVLPPPEPTPPPPTPAVVVIRDEGRSERRDRHDTITHRTSGSFGTGFGCTMGVLFALLAFSLASTVFVCGGGIAMLGLTANAVSKHQNAPVSTVVAGQQSQAYGPLNVAVKSADIGQVDLLNLGRPSISEEKLLKINLHLWTDDPAFKYDYESPVASLRPHCRLVDSKGNTYKHVIFGFTTEVVGRTKKAAVQKGHPVDDTLVFEAPVEAAGDLTLEIELANLKGANDSRCRFTIPESMWRPK